VRNINDCPHHYCGRNGFCLDISPPTGDPWQDFRCVCDPGFEVVKFPVDPADPRDLDQTCVGIDDCPAEAPCGGNGPQGTPRGHCRDGWSSYTCSCSEGYGVESLPGLPSNQTCAPVNCGLIPDIAHATASPANNIEASYETPEWTYQCDDGYTLGGDFDNPTSFTMRCMASGSFSAARACVAVQVDFFEPHRVRTAFLRAHAG